MFQFLERPLVFRPISHAQHWVEAPPALGAEDVWLQLGMGVTVHGWWCPPAGWTPAQGALLYSQGYRGNLSQRGETIRRWQERVGRAVLIYDYPGYGRSTGKPSEDACYAAATAACDWLTREKGVAPRDVLLYGGSLGGGVAIELATRRPYRAVVLVGAFTSIPDMAARRYPWLPVRRFIRNRFDNLAKIGCIGRVFIAHGTADRFVPFSMAERLFAAAAEPKRLFPMTGFDHHHTPGPEFYTAIADFLQEIEHDREHARQGHAAS